MGVSGDLRGPQCEFRAIFSDDAAAAVACEPWAAAEAPCAEVAAGRRAWGEVAAACAPWEAAAAAACAPWEAAAGVACAPWEEEGVACAPRAAEAAALCAAAEVVVPCGLWGAAAEDRVAAAGRQTPEPRGAARVLRRPGSL